MATLLETMSLLRLLGLGVLCLITLLVVGLLGGLLAPDPTGAQSHLVRYCDTTGSHGAALVHEYNLGMCRAKGDSLKDFAFNNTQPDKIVMWTQFPHAKSHLNMARWHQFMIASLSVQLDDMAEHQYHPGAKLRYEATLAYKDRFSEKGWQVIKESLMTWDFNCKRKYGDWSEDTGTWDCEDIPFFELGSLHHDYYLVNLRLPTNRGHNTQLGTIDDIHITAIHQNGGFTQIFLGIKTVMAHFTIILLGYFLRGLWKSNRPVTLFQKSIVVLGLSTLALNFPIDWLTLWVEMRGMLLWSDIRQGFFFAQLVLFLIIFMGEHCADDKDRRTWKSYATPIVSTGLATGALLLFDLSERGRQLFDPFYSVWSTDNGRFWGVTLISIATLAISLDVLYLIYLAFKAIYTLRNKILLIPNMEGERKNFYKSMLRRVTAMIIITVLIGIATVAMFALMHYSEVHLKWNEFRKVNLTSATYFCIYTLWNCYALTIMLLYTPQPDVVEGELEPEDKEQLLKTGPMIFQLIAKDAQE